MIYDHERNRPLINQIMKGFNSKPTIALITNYMTISDSQIQNKNDRLYYVR
jgi:hypothetical protein